MSSSHNAQAGLTLIELLVGLAILVIVLAIGVPSFDGIGNSSRLSSAANELGGAVQLARSEAIRRNRNVVLCRSANATTCAAGSVWTGWIVFADDDGDDQVSSGESIIRVGTVDGPQLRASTAISSRSDRITFLSSGRARGADERALLTATLALCLPTRQPLENTRDVSIAFGSRVSVQARDSGGSCAAPSNS